jgi:thiaminase/transcriptional activator TenA
VGKALLERRSPNPLYQRWIDTYGGEAFAAVVQQVLAVTDRIGQDLSAAEHRRMHSHVLTTTRYEWMFWDAGWRQETWPV